MAAQGPRGATPRTWGGTGRSHEAELGGALGARVSGRLPLSGICLLLRHLEDWDCLARCVPLSPVECALTGRHAETLIW